jgi:hypothetical protein
MVGVVFLGIALLLAVAGQTVLRSHLDGALFLFYWMACLVALGLAVATALLDILIVRHEAQTEQIELLRQTLQRTSIQQSTTPPPTPQETTTPAPATGRPGNLTRSDPTRS